jgi:aspartyl-tRNA(Asn)/glutamyl-tRNA(Gln) amidotransferase subunit B
MPKLPNEKRVGYKNLGLAEETIEQIISDARLDHYFALLVLSSAFVDASAAKLAANYLVSDVVPMLETKSLADLRTDYFAELMSMLVLNEINSRVAKDILQDLFGAQESPRSIATTRNLLQISDVTQLVSIVDEIISANPSVVAEYKGGKESSLQFLVGQGMKATRGSANPVLLAEAFKTAFKDK